MPSRSLPRAAPQFFWTMPIVLAAVAVAAPVAGRLELGPIAHHMAVHIALMNVAAPLLALGLLVRVRDARAMAATTWAATAAQLIVLWLWHAPATLAFAHASPLAHLAMQCSVLVSATWFWLAVLSCRATAVWRGIVALLVTGKLFCLLGAIITFAPRSLYQSSLASFDHGAHATTILEDQHLAGIMMLAACPLTYIAAAMVLMMMWLRDLGAHSAQPSHA